MSFYEGLVFKLIQILQSEIKIITDDDIAMKILKIHKSMRRLESELQIMPRMSKAFDELNEDMIKRQRGESPKRKQSRKASISTEKKSLNISPKKIGEMADYSNTESFSKITKLIKSMN